MLVWVGTIVGVVLGVAHAVYVYRVVAHGVPALPQPDQIRGIYYAFWTVLLWTLLGSYVFILWLVGTAMYLMFKAFR